MTPPKLYIIAGCNGAGKTTASYTILPDILNCKEFVNADEIAKGLSPFNPESMAIEAGKIMLRRIDELIETNTTFAIETTLATRTYQHMVRHAKRNGYIVILIFFWLKSPILAFERVASRVLSGGHNIPQDIIERRYLAGLRNLFNIFIPIVDEWLIIDNSEGKNETIATKDIIINKNTFLKLQEYVK